MSYLNRRYRVANGRLEKAWHGRDDDGWVKTKAEAWAAAGASAGLTPSLEVDWSKPWLAVLNELKALGFPGGTKAEAIEWARSKGVSVPE